MGFEGPPQIKKVEKPVESEVEPLPEPVMPEILNPENPEGLQGAEAEEMFNLSPWDFDQSPNGWRKLEQTRDFSGAANLIQEYISRNKDKILNPKEGEKEVALGLMYFHVGQELACAGQSNWSEAIQAFQQSVKDGRVDWNAYVSATIGFLEGDIKKIDNAISAIENSQEYKEGNKSGNLHIVKNFKKALEAGERDYEKAYSQQPEILVEPTQETTELKNESGATEEERQVEYLENSKRIGDYYVSLINSFLGKDEANIETIASLENTVKDKLAQIAQRAKDGFEQQHIIAQANNFDARKLLGQVPSFSTPEISEKLADTSKYRSEELSSGLFALYIEPKLYNELRGGAQGVAVKIKGGVSFIMLPDYPDATIAQSQRAENIPHETHHLVWNFSKVEVIKSDEPNHDLAEAFLSYQDEVMARLCSDGGLAGYTHLQMLDPETRKQFEQEHPDTAKQITETMVALNDLLQETDQIRKQTDIKKEDLILAIMDATNFEQLKQNILQIKTIIEKQPITKELPKSNNGWGFVS